MSSHSSHDPAQPLTIQPCRGCGDERYILKQRFELNLFISRVVLRWLVETSTGSSRDVAHLSHSPLPSGVVLVFTVNLGIPGQFLLSHTYCVCMCARTVYIRGQYRLCVRVCLHVAAGGLWYWVDWVTDGGMMISKVENRKRGRWEVGVWR